MGELSAVADIDRRPASIDDIAVAVDEPDVDRAERRRARRRPGRHEAIVFLYAPFLAAASVAFASTPDDPFITLRYAANLVHGYGPVFNRGQHVEGFTSPLHLVVAVVLYLVPGGHDLFKLKLASLLFGLLAVGEAGRLLYGLALPRWLRRAGCLVLATSWIVAFSSGNGLETTLAMWLLVMLARRLVLDGPRRSPLSLSVIALATVLARPDALLVIVFLALAALVIERPLPFWRRVGWWRGAVVGAVAVALAGQLYFGDPLPNTYGAKDLALGRAFADGRRYLVTSLQPGTFGRSWGGVSIGLLIVQVVLLALGIYTVVKRFPRCGYLLAMVVAQLLFIVKSGGDWMIGGRFVAPAVLPLILLQLLGFSSLAPFVRRHAREHVTRGAVVLGVCAVVATSVFPLWLARAPAWRIRGIDDRSLLSSGHYDQFSAIWTALAHDVRCLHPGELVATSEVGYVGFVRQDLRILDLRGLTDRQVATTAPSSDKVPQGVDDPDWYRPTSPVGRVLLRDRPDLIASFDSPPRPTVLGGAYRLTKVSDYGGIRLSLYVPSVATGADSDGCASAP